MIIIIEAHLPSDGSGVIGNSEPRTSDTARYFTVIATTFSRFGSEVAIRIQSKGSAMTLLLRFELRSHVLTSGGISSQTEPRNESTRAARKNKLMFRTEGAESLPSLLPSLPPSSHALASGSLVGGTGGRVRDTPPVGRQQWTLPLKQHNARV